MGLKPTPWEVLRNNAGWILLVSIIAAAIITWMEWYFR